MGRNGVSIKLMAGIDEKHKPKNKRQAFLRLLEYLAPYKKAVSIGVIANLWMGLVVLAPPLIYGKNITDRVILNHLGESGPARWRLLLISTAAQIILYGSSSFMVWVRMKTMHILGERILVDIRKQVYARLQTLSLSYFDRSQTGEIMSRVTNDSEVVEEFVTHAADTLVSDAIRLAAMCIIMFYVCKTLALISLLPVPIIFVLALTFSRKVRPIYRKVRERLAEINAKVQENISGIRVIKAFAREEHEETNFENDIEAFYDMRVRAIGLWTRFFPTIDFQVRTASVIVWAVGAAMILHNVAGVTMGTLIIFTMYLGMFYEPVRSLATINDTIQRSLAAAERIFEVIDEQPQIEDVEGAADLPRVQGRVEFDHVNFSYGGDEEVLNDICIKAEPGQIVALVGRSGAGKTSIVNLIPRFYDPISGRILVDGFDVKYVTQASLRGQIAMVLQDTFLFNGTVRENIRYGKLDATEEEIIQAANAANAAEFIEVMQDGYDTEIGERGIKLSGGQKQRLAIARAILADPRILILDEATSSVDSESEYLIHRAMDRLMEGRTTFVIAHRLSTIKHADQIITLEKGSVSEVGDHKTLVDQDGVYAQMYEMQFKLNDENQ
ncbi:MAG: ABC transporter ATP-binding protein [Armatimonadetes bacterium]|jgi:subfamily B ATP-binding cassette protein MsbA|nr:ABC transporter ATP-binding protein [Armatimonadota bacterium]